jgi:hypothetical protein
MEHLPRCADTPFTTATVHAIDVLLQTLYVQYSRDISFHTSVDKILTHIMKFVAPPLCQDAPWPGRQLYTEPTLNYLLSPWNKTSWHIVIHWLNDWIWLCFWTRDPCNQNN